MKRIALASAVLLSACGSKELIPPPGMPLPVGLHLTSVRHPALAYGSVTGEASGKPPAVEKAYARELRGHGWQVELHRGRLVARRGPWELDARLYAHASRTLFAAEERHSHFYVVPRPRAKVNPQFFASRVDEARRAEQLAWRYEREKKLRQSASTLEYAIAIAADGELLAQRFAKPYAGESHQIILDSRMRLGFVLARQKQRTQAFVEWRKLLHDVSSNERPPHNAKDMHARAWSGLVLALDARTVGTAPTHDELAFVHVLLAAEKTQPHKAPIRVAERKPQPKRHKAWWKFWK
jgi:hypothetical protein